jgi:hypothetical protein
VSEPTHPTTALQTFREAHTEAIVSENWLLAAGLDQAWQQAVNECRTTAPGRRMSWRRRGLWWRCTGRGHEGR